MYASFPSILKPCMKIYVLKVASGKELEQEFAQMLKYFEVRRYTVFAQSSDIVTGQGNGTQLGCSGKVNRQNTWNAERGHLYALS